ncbi:hypothetical protein [Streptomyces sp. NPDC057557]|uniref:hypothetical protein n=1 Tax=Streptomyces sp. NPDC057557 TaxID=3346167 RepID=UPI0036C1EA27
MPTGRVNPSGRLAETIPFRPADTPSFHNFSGEHGHVRHGEGVTVGYRAYESAGVAVPYPFGHGVDARGAHCSSLPAGRGGAVQLVAARRFMSSAPARRRVCR